MNQPFTKILLFLGITILFASCNAVKGLEENQLLLTENRVVIDNKYTKNEAVYSLLSQRPNPSIPIFGIPLGLHIYNIAEEKPDSTFKAWLKRKPNREKRLNNWLSKKQVNGLNTSKVKINEWIRKNGSAPVVIDEKRAEKSLKQLKKYFYTQGWFNVDGNYKVIKDSTKQKRGSITYNIDRKKPYVIDSISKKISSPVIDSIFETTKNRTFIKSGDQYNAFNFGNERERLTIQLRNSGLYYFDQDYVQFEADTNNLNQKVNIEYIIPNRRVNEADSSKTVPFKIHTINEVRIISDYNYKKREALFTDSITHNGYKIYGYDKINYRPKVLTNAVSIAPNEIFKDIDRTLTYNQIGQLRNFKYPSISYQEDPRDSTGTGLISTIVLTPRDKSTFDFNLDTYTSPIQQFGIGFSSTFLRRNIFKGAENLEIGITGSIGSSVDVSETDNRFFNTSDVGANIKLSFPTILFPLKTEKIIPYYMAPTTSFKVGINGQNNIGLDRQNINGMYTYAWKSSRTKTHRLDVANLQYVRNLNTDNYFNVYRNSYDRLNEIARNVGYEFQNEEEQLIIPTETDTFLDVFFTPENGLNPTPDDIDEMISQRQRKNRLTENNLIFATTYNWIRDTRESLADDNFSILQFKAEIAGNTLSALSSAVNLDQNTAGKKELFGVVFSQYSKLETNFIKHWELGSDSRFAIRAFGGIAIPYGNSSNIPFLQSYFAGGTNDNRGWVAYNLGPGSSGGLLDFNEANFKLAFNAEYRFTFFGGFKGAFFADVGNIWNVFDDVEQEAFRFDGLQDLQELAIATGFGLRYDFGFFVVRLDLGFKTYDPGRAEGQRWFKEYNFANTVYNIGINYPF